MNLRQLDYILAVCELGNFGRAAKKCFITQSTLSTMIARFEEEINVILFDRKQKPILLTKEGKKVIQQLRIIEKEVNRLDEVISDLKGNVSGSLKIGVIPTVGPYLLPFFLNDFAQKFPNLIFEVSEITTDKIVQQIRDRSLDIGVVSTPLGIEGISEHFLYSEPFLLFDSQNTYTKNVHIKDINFDRIWLMEEGHCMRNQVQGICDIYKRQIPTQKNLRYKSGTIDTLLKFVRRNSGLTLLPYLAAIDLSLQDQKFLHYFTEPLPARNIGLIVHEHFVRKKILNDMFEEIQKNVKPLLPNSGVSLQSFSPQISKNA